MTPIHYSQVEKHPLAQILAGAAVLDHVPQFDGTVYVSQYPVSAFNAGTAIGRVSEINVIGSGGFASVSGKRLTINVDKGVNARSVSPSVGVYQAVANLDFGAGLTTSFSAGTVTVSTAASTPQINLTNNNAGVGIVQTPGTNSAFVLKSLVGAGGTTVQDMGSYIQINSTSGGGGSITLGNTGTGQGIVVSPGTGSSFSLKGLVGVNGITVQDFGNYLQINGAGVGGSYTHPSYTPQSFTPTLVGTTLTVAGFSRDSIGSVETITPFSFILPSGGGGIAGISLNNTGSYTNINFGSGFSLSGNTVTATGAGHTLGNGALGAGIISVPGFAASHTLKGLVGGGATTVTDMGSHILISSTAGGGGTGTVEVRYNDITVNPAAAIINFKGPGVTSVTNGIGVEITIAGGGGGGITGVSVNGVGTYTNLIFNGAGVSVSGNQVTVAGAGLVGTNGNGLVVGSNTVTLNLATIGSPGAMPALTGFSSQYLSGAGTWQIVPNLPSANVNETLRYNGTAWEATTAVRAYANGDVVLGSNARFSIGNASNTFQFGSNFSTNVSDTFTVRFQTPPSAYTPIPGMFTLIGGGSNNIVFQADLTQTKLGFFGATPVTKPSTTNDITSVRNALIALGLIS